MCKCVLRISISRTYTVNGHYIFKTCAPRFKPFNLKNKHALVGPIKQLNIHLSSNFVMHYNKIGRSSFDSLLCN